MDDHIEAYVDGTLSPDDRARFEAGLRADPAWEREIRRAHTIRAVLRTQSVPPPPSSLTRAILQHAATPPSDANGPQ